MKRIPVLLILLALALAAASCLREWQTDSMLTPSNSKVFLDELHRSVKKSSIPPGKRIGISLALKEGDSLTPKTTGVARTVGNYYTFKSDDMSEHQKIMIDDFLKESINYDDSIVRVTDERDSDLLVVAYIRSYTWHRYLHFDIFDSRMNSEIGNIKYELSKLTTAVEKK